MKTQTSDDTNPIAGLGDHDAAARRATANSAFFTLLPPELRRRILVEAFGSQTVHIYRPFMAEPSTSELPVPARRKRWFGFGRQAAHVRHSTSEHPAPAQGKSRFGRVCRRQPNNFMDGVNPDYAEETNPTRDTCFRYFENRHWCPKGDMPHNYVIGALGWLQSCHQA